MATLGYGGPTSFTEHISDAYDYTIKYIIKNPEKERGTVNKSQNMNTENLGSTKMIGKPIN